MPAWHISRASPTRAGFRASCNILPAPAVFASTANDEIVDEAGWLRGPDGVGARDGVRLSVLFQQALIQQMWEQIGVETELRDVDAGIFFGTGVESPDSYAKFYADIQMFANGFNGDDPEPFFANWMCKGIPDPENQWLGGNTPRICDGEYDEMIARMADVVSPKERADLAMQLNDVIVQNYYVIPLVWRASVSAYARTLKGVRMNPWDSELWNAADWHR